MCVVVTPAISAATALTAVSSSYQPRSIGSRDSAKAATASATNASARSGSAPRRVGDAPCFGDQRGVKQPALGQESLDAAAQLGEKNRVSAVASIDVNTRNGLWSN